MQNAWDRNHIGKTYAPSSISPKRSTKIAENSYWVVTEGLFNFITLNKYTSEHIKHSFLGKTRAQCALITWETRRELNVNAYILLVYFVMLIAHKLVVSQGKQRMDLASKVESDFTIYTAFLHTFY